MEVSKSKPSRHIGVDIIRVLAMLMVINLHTILNFTIRPDFFATKAWVIFEPFEVFSKIGVLLFFMISGYLVIGKNRSIKDNWEITKNRILFPLGIFSMINLGYNFYRFSLTGKNLSLFWQGQLHDIPNFPNSPLWFLFTLFFLYLLNPIWQIIFAKEKDSNIAIYLTKLSLLFSITTTIIRFLGKDHTLFFNGFTVWIGYLFFYFYGGLVKNNWIAVNKVKINILMIVSGLLLTMFGDYYTAFAIAHSKAFILSGYFFEYLSIPITLMSVGVFNILISTNFDRFNHKIVNIFKITAGLSYGVYLIHPLVISLLTDILGFDFDKLHLNVYMYSFSNYFLVLGISLIMSYFLNPFWRSASSIKKT